MMTLQHTIRLGIAAGLIAAPMTSHAFNSGSTGADGAFNPTVNTVLTLPPNGVFNFTTVNIPIGVTVTFKKNSTNTPVTILASGDVTVAGQINIAGGKSPETGAGGDGNLGDDGIPGKGGPGGYDGGAGGGAENNTLGGNGLGPGGGGGGGDKSRPFVYIGYQGLGGGMSTDADSPYGNNPNIPRGGLAYGSSLLLPLVGGSGGGGGQGNAFKGSGGGGGGGAILIASSGTVSISDAGSVLASGGNSGIPAGSGAGTYGGGGSGGAIRIVASTISGNGQIIAAGGCTVYCGAPGRIRFESDRFLRTSGTNPAFVVGVPGPLFVAGFPTLRITSVAGVAVPAVPTGSADVRLAADAPNPATVLFVTTGVPVGNTVKLTVTPANAGSYSAVSPALSGNTTVATASVSVDLPTGPSVLQATTTYTIVASLGDELSRFAQGERVERVTLTATLGGESLATLITVSGKTFDVPLATLAAFPMTN